MTPLAGVSQHESWDMSVTSLSGCMAVVFDGFAPNLLAERDHAAHIRTRVGLDLVWTERSGVVPYLLGGQLAAPSVTISASGFGRP